LGSTYCEAEEWMELAQDYVQWQASVLAVLILLVLLPQGRPTSVNTRECMDRPVCIDCKLHCFFCSNASVLGYAVQVSKKLIH
jgi:hypothetical protein